MFGNYPKHQLEKLTIIPPFEGEFTEKKITEEDHYKRLQANIHRRIWKFKPVATS